MITIVSRFYKDEKKAKKAFAALQEDEFLDRDIDMITAKVSGEDDAANVDTDGLIHALQEAGLYKKAASAYAAAYKKGSAVIVVRAPFGWTKSAVAILDAHDPTAVEEVPGQVFSKESPKVAVGSHPPSNIIRSQHGNVLLDSNQKLMSSGERPGLIASGALMASIFGKPLIEPKKKNNLRTNDMTPFSSRFSLPLLRKPPAPNSVKRSNLRPFSSVLGLKTISRGSYS